ncbi:MAG: carboxypeptidase M32 [Thermoplasmatota archaeon]
MPSAYESLLVRAQRLEGLRQTLFQLEWDQHTYMPPGGVPARAHEIAVLSSLSHEILTAQETGRLLAEAEKSETGADALAILRELRWAYDRATLVPPELVEEMAREASVAFPKWVEAKTKSDFALFLPHLETLVDQRRRYAAYIDKSAPAYAVLFNDYEPWIPLEDARRVITAAREGLRPIISKAASAPPPRDVFAGQWAPERQMALCRRVVTMLGYDFDHGRLDVSPHPFTSGNQFDSRITTRFDPATPISGLLAAVHEAGHALYQLGLPKDHFGDPLGDARDLVVHESQSRLWENHVGRSLPFWEKALPMVREAFPGMLSGVTPHDAWSAVNRVKPSLIRVYADELTYHMHIALRFEIEEGLISGRIAVRDVPSAWNDLMQKHLGLRPKDDASGCLQDMHWSSGSFGYFPTYSLGSILAAQLYAAYGRATQAEPTDYATLRAWLVENVHRHGKRYRTMDLVAKATGTGLRPDAFLEYARSKYLAS